MIKNLSLILLGSALTFALFNLHMCASPREGRPIVACPGHCDDKDRWMADIPAKSWEITEAQRNKYSNLFRSACPVTKSSVFISKHVFDTLFTDLTANGIVFYFGLDTLRRPLLVLEANRGDSTKIQRSSVSGTGIYYQRTYCPPTCGDTGDTTHIRSNVSTTLDLKQDSGQLKKSP